MKKEDKIQQTPGEKLKALMKERGCTQAQLAEYLKCSVNYISMIVQGTRNLTLKKAQAIAKKFNVRFQWLLGFDDFKTEGERASAIIKNKYDRPEIIEQLIELHGYSVSVEKMFTVRKMETEVEQAAEDKRAKEEWCKDWRTSSCHLQYPPNISDEEMLRRFHAQAPETILSIRSPSGKIVCRYLEKQEYDRIIQDIDDYIEMRLSFLFRDTSYERIPIKKGADYSNG